MLLHVFGRPLLLVFWALVAWGTLHGIAVLWAVLREGPGDALARVLSGPHRDVGEVNLALSGLAALVWLAVGIAAWRRRVRTTRGVR